MTINISNIKTAFKTIMDAANDTAATFDLSAGLNRRVQKVLKLNPALIPPQASFFPFVTISLDRKPIELTTIAKDQITGKRRTDLSFNVVGAVWEQVMTAVTEDPADENIEKLMENVEEVLRRNFKLNDTVSWSRPSDVTYHTLQMAEQTHMRVGVMTLVCRVDY